MNKHISPPGTLIEGILIKAMDEPQLSRLKIGALLRRAMKNTKYSIPSVIKLWASYWHMVKDGKIKRHAGLEKVLRVKDVRTDSGVAPITVLTKPYPCPGKCVYCPFDARMPKSYLPTEPAAARALSLKFDPYEQVKKRVEILERNGHEAKKIELIIKGGTWSAYPWKYRVWFIKRCFDAANHFEAESSTACPKFSIPALKLKRNNKGKTRYATLKQSQNANEKAAYRIIGLTIETRPDWIDGKEIVRLRELGCTRVELGVQTLRDDVLKLTKRGHELKETIRAVALLKQAGFKTDFHVLPGQPGTTPESDVQDFKMMFDDPRFRPDMVKIYPCVVLPTSELQSWTEQGRFTPLQGDQLKEVLISMQEYIPRYCRVSRMIRDFPLAEISFGNKITNLREEIESEMKRRGLKCQCLRCREIGHVPEILATHHQLQTFLFEERYENAGGKEVFLSIEDEKRQAVFAFLRLRIPNFLQTDDAKLINEAKLIKKSFPVLKNTAIIRELHTYGKALNLGMITKDASQHRGYGRELMEAAEKIAKQEGFYRIAVISGIGVREYYRRLGYHLQKTYMVKKLI